MRWTFRIAAALALAWVIFLVSPFVALHNFAREVETRDVEVIRERVNFRALRVSLLKQVFNVAVQEKGGRALDPAERQFVIEAAAGVAEPVVAQLLTPEAVLDLLNDGWPNAVLGPVDQGVADGAPIRMARHLRMRSLASAWRLFRNSEMRGFRNIIVSLPPDRPPDRQFRLRLRLARATWTLVNIELPTALLQALARKMSSHMRQGQAATLQVPAGT
jgi:Protein of unknown function (DUF2939)